ncbi:GntR family transcriptional regulator [Pseudorhodoplanes sinuspersici]|nr:GntR family transcriptional regulator [Pseudorhodoplanes sinuspersici]
MPDHGISVSRFSTRPLYLQARDAIAQRIAAGEWKPHVAIPNENELARTFGVSPGTMRKALDLAEAERLLTRRQGRGTFVNDPSSGEQRERYNSIRGRDGKRICGDVEVLNLLETTVNERECLRLRLRLRERVIRIRRLRLTDGKPYMLEDVAMPAKLFPNLTTHQDASQRFVVLAQQFGVLLGKGEERLAIGAAAPDVAAALQVEEGATVMRLDRVIYTLEGKPAEWRLGQCLMEGRHYLAELN